MLTQKEKGLVFGAILTALKGLRNELSTRDRTRHNTAAVFLINRATSDSQPSRELLLVEEALERFKTTWKIKKSAPHDVVTLVPWVYQNLGLSIEEQDQVDKDLWVDGV